MEHSSSHFFWCRTCGKKLTASVTLLSSAGTPPEGAEVNFTHILKEDDTHMPVPSFVPVLVVKEFRDSQ